MIKLPRRAFVLDIETTDTRPTARVLTIGIALVDTAQRTVDGIDTLRLDLHQQAFRTQSDETMAFWRAQPDHVREAAFKELPRSSPADAMVDLENIIQSYGRDDFTVWGNGASFDLVIIEDLCRDFGYGVPWTYRQHRDLRTLYELAGVKVSPEDRNGLIPHRALDDAIAEARAMVRALDILLGVPPIAVEATGEA